MNSSNTSARALKRVLQDIAEVQKSTIRGLSLCMPDTTNPFTLHGNVVINEGTYRDLLIHLIIIIPPDYPVKSPKFTISKGLNFGNNYHHHIYDASEGNRICIDLNSDYTWAFDQSEKSGWTPAYTLLSLLMQLQLFFADPDYPEESLPSEEMIAELKKHVRDYKLDIQVNDGENTSTVTHSYDAPYPPVRGFPRNSDVKRVLTEKPQSGDNILLQNINEEEYKKGDENKKALSQKSREEVTCQWGKPLKKIPKNNTKTISKPEEAKLETMSVTSTKSNSAESDNNKENSPIKPVKLQRIKKAVGVPKLSNKEISDKLYCPILKTDIFDPSEPILGYPLNFSKIRHQELTLTPIMETLSYEAFMLNFPDGLPNDKICIANQFVSGTGSKYNFWLPAYINETHFNRSKEHLFKAILLIHNTITEEVQAEFDPTMTLRVLPPILTNIMTEFTKGNLHQSTAAVDAYSQLSYLFAKLAEAFPTLQEAIDFEVRQFCLHKKYRTVDTTGDLGQFIVKLALSSQGINSPELLNLVLKEHLARQVPSACKKDKGLKFPQKCSNFVARFMSATQSANQFLMLQIETAKLFLSGLDLSELEANYGLPSEKQVRLFKMRFDRIRSTVGDNWSVFIEGIKQDLFILDEKVMTKYIINSYCGY